MINFYRVTPVSVVFFRDPRPFTAGEQALARLQFPPRLTPFLGAIRTKYLQEIAGDQPISALFPDVEDDLKQISIFWFSLVKDGTPLIPAPCDLLAIWKTLDENRFVVQKMEVDGRSKNPKIPFLDPHKIEYLKNVHYLTPEGFAKYQNGQTPSEGEYFSLDQLWEFENRVGIGLNPGTKTAERSKFYRITVARPKKGVGFLVGVEFGNNIEVPPIFESTFTARLGGEGHIAVWEKVDNFEAKHGSINFSELVALAHVPITSDGKPIFEIKNWCINKLDIISGWDYRERRPKPLVKALKPGAVITVKPVNQDNILIYKIKLFEKIILNVIKDFVVLIKNEKIGLRIISKTNLDGLNSLFLIKK